MKKLLLAILMISLLLSLVSCGECKEHVDSDKNGICDECEAQISVEPENPEEPEDPEEPENPENPENPEIPEETNPSEIETPKVEF